MQENNTGWWIGGGLVLLLIWFGGKGCDSSRPGPGGSKAYKIDGQWVLTRTDRASGRLVSDPVQTPRGLVRYEKRGWWGGWKAVPQQPMVWGGGYSPPIPRPGSSSSSSSTYTGLSDAEKQAIWRQATPKMSYEERDRRIKRGF